MPRIFPQGFPVEMPASLFAGIVCICVNCRNCREMQARVCKFRHCFEMDSVHRGDSRGETVQTNQLRQFAGQLCRDCCLSMHVGGDMRRNMSPLRREKYFSCVADHSMHVMRCYRDRCFEGAGEARNAQIEECCEDSSPCRLRECSARITLAQSLELRSARHPDRSFVRRGVRTGARQACGASPILVA